jgi:hypothetical protein
MNVYRKTLAGWDGTRQAGSTFSMGRPPDGTSVGGQRRKWFPNQSTIA